MRYYALILAPFLFSITGCSYHYEIVATEQSGAIVFKPAEKTGTGCFSDFFVKDQAGKVVWKVTTERYLPPPCDNRFPITYGVKPQGMTEDIKPLSLQAGITYRVEGWDGDSYSGTFRFKQGIVIENIPEPR